MILHQQTGARPHRSQDFVDTRTIIRFIRRLVRDIKERGRTVDSVVEQYLTVVAGPLRIHRTDKKHMPTSLFLKAASMSAPRCPRLLYNSIIYPAKGTKGPMEALVPCAPPEAPSTSRAAPHCISLLRTFCYLYCRGLYERARTNLEKALLAEGALVHGSLFKRVPGVVQVQSGYCGGSVSNPTMNSLSKHHRPRRTVEVSFDPSRISIRESSNISGNSMIDDSERQVPTSASSIVRDFT